MKESQMELGMFYRLLDDRLVETLSLHSDQCYVKYHNADGLNYFGYEPYTNIKKVGISDCRL